MKKFLSLLLVMVMFASMTVGVGAALPSGDVSTLKLGDSFSFYYPGNDCRYYKFTVPYTGVINLDITAYCTSKGNFLNSFGYFRLYTSYGDNISEKEFYKKDGTVGKTYDVGNITLELDAGTYYIYFYEIGYDDTFKFTVKTSFSCSHTNKTTKTTVEPTCTSTGTEVTTCNDCRETVRTDTLSKLPHTPEDEWTRTKEPTCAAKGEEQKNCTVCGGIADTQDIAKLPHTYGDWVADSEPTCSKEGKKSRVCSACGDKETDEIDKLDHDYGAWEITDEATCTSKGKETRECKNCGKSETNNLDMLDHDFGKWETTVAASCTKTGKESRECKSCGKTETQSVDMLDHSYLSWEETTKATCTSNGKETRKCKNCGKTETRTTDKIDHYYDDWKVITKATCTTVGKEQGECILCNKTITENIPMLDHDFGEWQIVTEATCTAKGKKSATCKDCGKSETETIKMLDHDYGEPTVTTEPTCTKSGKQTKACKSCGKTTSETIDKAEHSVEEWTITKEATETKSGTRKGKCTVCGKSITENYEKPKYPGKSGFKQSRNYGKNFTDVTEDKWFFSYVETAYEYSLVNGMSQTKFSPESKFTVAQALTTAVNIHSAYYDKKVEVAKADEKWYTPYVNYCIENGIIGEDSFADFDRNITRGEMAIIYANVLPSDEYTVLRDGMVADMSSEMESYTAVEKLYRAGIVSGDAGTGKYRPNDEIIRSEACVIFTRIAVETYRAK